MPPNPTRREVRAYPIPEEIHPVDSEDRLDVDNGFDDRPMPGCLINVGRRDRLLNYSRLQPGRNPCSVDAGQRTLHARTTASGRDPSVPSITTTRRRTAAIPRPIRPHSYAPAAVWKTRRSGRQSVPCRDKRAARRSYPS